MGFKNFCRNRRKNRFKSQRGLTLIELIVAFTIMLVLTTMAVPLARSKVRVMRERELRIALREMHSAIDKYKDYADLGYLGPQKLGTNNWPETLRIPVDPFTGKAEWGLRSDQDDPKSLSWGGQCVFDVYSKTMEKAADGKPYSE